MYIPRIIFITKEFSFIVRLLHFVCIRSVLKLKYERYGVLRAPYPCTIE